MLRKTGNWAVPWLAAFMVVGIALIGIAPKANAFDWYSWSPGSYQTVGSILNPSESGRDITAAYYGFDADYRFFRLDLAGAPDMGGNGYAPLYQFSFNSSSGSGSLGTVAIPLSPPTLNFYAGSTFSEVHFHFRSDSSLEWAIKKEDLPDTFAWYAITANLGSGITGIFDLTSPALATPIPSAAWLLGSGVIALIGLRRRKVTRYSFS